MIDLSRRQCRRMLVSPKRAPVSALNSWPPYDVLVSDDVGEHVAPVQQHHEPPLVEARMTLQPVEACQGLVVDVIELARNARAPAAA